jgi:hypothetical protein
MTVKVSPFRNVMGTSHEENMNLRFPSKAGKSLTNWTTICFLGTRMYYRVVEIIQNKQNISQTKYNVKISDDGRILTHIIVFLHIIHLPVLDLKHNVSETWFCFRLQVKTYAVGPDLQSYPCLRTPTQDRMYKTNTKLTISKSYDKHEKHLRTPTYEAQNIRLRIT